jgi:adenylate cyclase
MIHSDHIFFSNLHVHYAITFVDVVGSTSIVAKLPGREADVLYMTFLNSISDIIVRGGGSIIKTVGDGIMYYFPKTDFGVLADYEAVLRVGLDVIHAHREINDHLHNLELPTIDYRLSASFGPVSIIENDENDVDDLFGTTVNTCAKMNKLAEPNSLIIGSVLYEKVKDTKLFKITQHKQFTLDEHLSYMTYLVQEK